MKENICFITASYPDYEGSYRGSFIKKIVSLLKRDGYRISIVTPRIFSKSKLTEIHEGEKIYRFPFFSEEKLLVEYTKIPILRMVSYLFSGILKSYKVIKKEKCRLIHAHWVIPTGFIAVLVGGILRIPVIVSAHGSDISVFSRRSSLLRKITKFVLRKANLITSNAYHLTKEMAKLGIPQKKIIRIVLGIDPDEFSEEISLTRDENITISVRNLTPLYNVKLLIKAVPLVVKELPQARFIIAGDGSERENLERLRKELKVERYVNFVGGLPHNELLEFLASSAVYVSTSLSDGTSLSLLEAMHYGAFPVVTDITANREWIKDGENGFLVPTDDGEVLGKKIVEALKNSDVRETARKINRKIIEEKALWLDNIRKLESLYSSLVKI